MSRGKRHPISTYKKATIFRRDDWKCRYCGIDFTKNHGVEMTVDHVVPWSKGGSDDERNLVSCCSRCNLHKGNKTVKEANMTLRAINGGPSWYGGVFMDVIPFERVYTVVK